MKRQQSKPKGTHYEIYAPADDPAEITADGVLLAREAAARAEAFVRAVIHAGDTVTVRRDTDATTQTYEEFMRGTKGK